jgi:hypothetical protein
MPAATFTIGGDDRKLISFGAALSLAQQRAAQRDDAWQTGVYRDGEQVARVERDDDGVIHTRTWA